MRESQQERGVAEAGESRQPEEWPVESEAATVRDSRKMEAAAGGKRACVAQDSRGSRGGTDSGTALHLEIWSWNSALPGGWMWTRTRVKIVRGKSKGIDAGWQLAE